MNSRALAASIIDKTLEQDGKSHELLREAFRRENFITALVHGTVSCALTLDFYLLQVSKKAVSDLKPYLRTVLRMGLYQIVYMDRIPASAAVNESVKLIRKRFGEGLTGFANGVLRAAARKTDWIRPEGAAAFSLPQPLYEYLTGLYGMENTRRMAEYFLEAPILWGRVNESRISPEEAVRLLEKDGFDAVPHSLIPGGLRISRRQEEKKAYSRPLLPASQAPVSASLRSAQNRCPLGTVRPAPGGGQGTETEAPVGPSVRGISLEQAEAIRGGFVQLQDLSAQLAVLAAAPQPGGKVLDLCAAPGGKSLQAADLMRNSGEVIACDLTEAKCRLIRENIEKSGFTCLKTRQADATVFEKAFEDVFDLVIADLPCSGLGTASRKPEIKYRVTKEQVAELAALQRQILQNAVRYVKPGGKLLYSTCTLTKEENADNALYIENELGLQPVPLALPEGIPGFTPGAHTLQILPGVAPERSEPDNTFRKACPFFEGPAVAYKAKRPTPRKFSSGREATVYAGDGFFISLFTKPADKKSGEI